MSVLKDKVVLVTGGTGSFGKKIYRKSTYTWCEKKLLFSVAMNSNNMR
ncbi:hypothetical protein OL548_09760 [Lysinibacillus sp. MHQ-1]|nr:hypothetical protein OL548_09760 [Lysinibacillus sp. MHQ-1]